MERGKEGVSAHRLNINKIHPSKFKEKQRNRK